MPLDADVHLVLGKFRASAPILTSCKPRFDTLSLISRCCEVAIMSPFLGPQPWEAPDPLPVMRRELKLLLIEMNLLRIEVEQSRSIRDEAQAREAFFSASVKRLTEGRDKWRREAERLRDLIDEGPTWLRFWRRLVDSFAASRRSASEWHRA
jgi:hypothetical protein